MCIRLETRNQIFIYFNTLDNDALPTINNYTKMKVSTMKHTIEDVHSFMMYGIYMCPPTINQ